MRAVWLSKPSPPALEALDPTVCVYAIGDLHGRADLLDRGLARIAADRGRAPATILCLGDYIDRGPDSAAVLARLMAEPDLICLKGNHEAMLLDFLKDPVRGALWLRHGAVETLASFGLTGYDLRQPRTIHAALVAVLPEAIHTYVADLPSYWQSGTLLAMHAGGNPNAAPKAQTDRDMLWGHRSFFKKPRKDGLWVVHGHWVRSAPMIEDGRISIDTGAWHSNQLTIARISRGDVRFLTVDID